MGSLGRNSKKHAKYRTLEDYLGTSTRICSFTPCQPEVGMLMIMKRIATSMLADQQPALAFLHESGEFAWNQRP